VTAIAVSLATLVMTLLGGVFALHFKDRLHLILGFSGAVGLIAYMVLDRAIEAIPESGDAGLRRNGTLAVASLCFHSVVDGFVIGLGFSVSSSLGIAVSVAVLAHDFSDGINSVSLVLGKNGGRGDALRWLALDAVAPVLGAGIALLLHVPPETLAVMLALCGGFFIYISASDLLPESYHDHPQKLTTLMTALGVIFLYLVTRAAEPR
jgi:zinc transporter, ZIP family